MKLNGDGSLDIFIQRQAPDGDKQRNWLPAPAVGRLQPEHAALLARAGGHRRPLGTAARETCHVSL